MNPQLTEALNQIATAGVNIILKTSIFYFAKNLSFSICNEKNEMKHFFRLLEPPKFEQIQN